MIGSLTSMCLLAVRRYDIKHDKRIIKHIESHPPMTTFEWPANNSYRKIIKLLSRFPCVYIAGGTLANIVYQKPERIGNDLDIWILAEDMLQKRQEICDLLTTECGQPETTYTVEEMLEINPNFPPEARFVYVKKHISEASYPWNDVVYTIRLGVEDTMIPREYYSEKIKACAGYSRWRKGPCRCMQCEPMARKWYSDVDIISFDLKRMPQLTMVSIVEAFDFDFLKMFYHPFSSKLYISGNIARGEMLITPCRYHMCTLYKRAAKYKSRGFDIDMSLIPTEKVSSPRCSCPPIGGFREYMKTFEKERMEHEKQVREEFGYYG